MRHLEGKNEMTNNEKLAKITKALEEGKTVTFSTAMRVIEITPKTYSKFITAGCDLFRATDDHLLINMGKRFDSVNGCEVFVA